MKISQVALGLWSVGAEPNSHPLEKAVTMVKELKQKAIDDKHAEQVMWSRFDQFATQETARLTDEIERLGTRKYASSDAAKQLEADADLLDQSVTDAEATLTEKQTGKKTFEEGNAATEHAYAVAYDDYHGAIYMLQKAVSHMQARNKLNQEALDTKFGAESLVQIWSGEDQKFLKKFGEKHTEILSLLKKDPVPDSLGSSRDVLSTLRDIRSKFLEEQEILMNAEHARKTSYLQTLGALDNEIDDLERTIRESTKNSARNRSYAGKEKALSQGYDENEKTLLDQKEGLSKTHGDKKVQYETRQTTRDNELKALDEAITILSGPLTSPAAATTSLLQLDGKAGASHLKKMTAHFFLKQRAAEVKTGGAAHALELLAEAAKNDAFDKVKEMIRGVLVRLEAEAAEEATHGAFCDKEVSETEENQTTALDNIKTHASAITSLSGEVAQQEKQIAELEEEKATAEDEKAKAIELNNAETAQRDTEIKETEDAKVALGSAMDQLRKYYAGTLEGGALLQETSSSYSKNARIQVHQTPEIFDDAPYTGQAGTGVIDFLDFLRAGFEADHESLEKERVAVKNAYVESQEEMAKTITGLETGIKEANAVKTAKLAELDITKGQLSDAKTNLDTVNAYYEELRPSCIAPFEAAAEDRAKQREETISACRDALNILTSM